VTEPTGTAQQAPFTIEQFQRFLLEEKIMAAKCKKCGSTFIPPRPVCTNCYSKELSWVQLKSQGRLVTFTVIYVAPEQFQPMAPYAYGIVELEDGLRLPGMIRGIEPEKVRVGIELQVGFDKNISQTWPHWPRYFFKPP